VTIASWAAGLAALLSVFAIRELFGGLRFPRRRAAPRRFRPLAVRVGAVVGRARLVRRFAPPETIRERLMAAGEPAGLGPREWTLTKAICAGGAGGSALILAGHGPGRLGLALALGAPLAGFVAPDFWLARVARARAEAAVRQLPDVLELLRVSVEAGMAPMRAMGAVSAEFDGPLAAECRRLAAGVELGQPQEEALNGLVERLPCEEVASFAEALRRARRHGLPLGRTLAAQASSARAARRRRLRERAARAGPKIQLAVALVLVPSVLLMVAAVLASELLEPGLVL
jgi:tight adherence protein C